MKFILMLLTVVSIGLIGCAKKTTEEASTAGSPIPSSKVQCGSSSCL